MVRSLALVIVIVGGLGLARADKVDWSQYIEKPGDHVVNKSAAASPPTAKPAKVANAPKLKKAPAKKAAKRPPAKKH